MAKNVDVILNRFFMARIGLRFLIEHHITTAMERQGYSGIIMPACSPVEIAQMAAVSHAKSCLLSINVSLCLH